MRKINKIYWISMITLLCSNLTFAQKVQKETDPIKSSKDRIVQQLNAPTKIWTNGNWKVQNDGTRIWEKGYWRFEEKTFQQKSEIFRNKLYKNNKA